MTRRTGLVTRLVSGQLAVAAAGVVSFVLVAAIITPWLFTRHLTESGETDATVQAHARDSLVASFLAAGIAALVVSGAVAVLLAVLAARRVARPLEVLARAAGRVDIDGMAHVDATDFSTEMDELYRALVDMSDRLARASTVRNQLLADLAHELRTPLASLEAHVDALEDKMIEAGPDTYAAMRVELARLRRLASDVRTAAAAQEHALDLQLMPEDLDRLAEAACTAAGPRFLAKGIDLRFRSAARPMPVSCDAARIHQVLANLLDNALRHTPVGGTVEVRATAGRREAQVSVTDDGDGITAEQLDAVFDRFFRADTSRGSFDGSGSGLGLTIAHGIVVDHGGRLRAMSEGVGRGSSFIVTMPTCRDAEASGPGTRTARKTVA